MLKTQFGHLEIITNGNQIPTATKYVAKTVITLLLLLCLNNNQLLYKSVFKTVIYLRIAWNCNVS